MGNSRRNGPHKRGGWLLIIGLWLGFAALSQAQGQGQEQEQELLWVLYDTLLQTYVSRHRSEGVELAWVDYSGLRQDPRFQQLLAGLAAYPDAALRAREARLAFYINAYNILAIKVVLDHWPLASIKDAGPWYRSVWDLEAGEAAGELLSLDQIEHERLRVLGEPRIHFAIVCASLSCPDLHTEAYRPQHLDRQLDDQARRFLNNPTKGVREDADGFWASKIFDWFADDFQPQGTLNYIVRYRPKLTPVLKGYLDYDWSLNGE
ncbi:DUF547 domain-containing protein [Motiliproteus sp. SC1-56]|uniref:DUF547 domain-containing protein n=1 Tax=Motiliproteus sp. SC1-56 TaxID=2799565 RepID=UPI001A8C2FF6|nr:DUF547 domain-containing protein [Motiliproteus sp. SC1-56]